MPTFTHGKNTLFKVADNSGALRDVSNVCNASGLARSCDAAETTAFGQGDKSYIAGLRDATVPIEGFADPTTDGYFAGILGHGTPVAWELYPMGSASGLIKYNGSAVMTRYETRPEVGDVVKMSGELQGTGAITRTVL